MNALRRLIDDPRFDLISVDCFDTLALLPPTPEILRFRRWAVRASTALRQAQLADIAPGDLWTARLKTTKPLYDQVARANEPCEVRLLDAMAAASRWARLPDSAIPLLEQAEIDDLRVHSRLNVPLVRLLQRRERVVITSDTPLTRDQLTGFFRELSPEWSPSRFYSSAEEQATKRHGHLFDRLLAEERVEAHRVLHVGDHPWSDLKVPSCSGIVAEILSRGWFWRVLIHVQNWTLRAALRPFGRLAP